MKNKFTYPLTCLAFFTVSAIALSSAPLTITVDTSQLHIQGHDNCGFFFSATRSDKNGPTGWLWTNSINNKSGTGWGNGTPIGQLTMYVPNPRTDFVRLNFGIIENLDQYGAGVQCSGDDTNDLKKSFPVPSGNCLIPLHDGAKVFVSGTIDKDGKVQGDFKCSATRGFSPVMGGARN